MRALLTRLLNPGVPIDLECLEGSSHARERQYIDDVCGIDSSEFTHRDLMPYRAVAYREYAHTMRAPCFIKLHDSHDIAGRSPLPADATRAAIYLLRNPIDVAVSFAHHAHRPVDRIIATMNDPNSTLESWPDRVSPFASEHLGTWSDHVRGWNSANDMIVHALRYEDLHDDPVAALRSVVAASGIETDDPAIFDAVESARFDNLASVEKDRGFSEKPFKADRFFRSGKTGEGHRALSKAQIDAIVEAHGDVMADFGYLP